MRFSVLVYVARRVALLFLVLGLVGSSLSIDRSLFADDWPTWRHDSGRSAVSKDSLPEELRLHVDCKLVTMAHARALKPLVGVVRSDVIEDLVNWIKETRASETQLSRKLRTAGLGDRRGKKRTFGVISNRTVFTYRFKIGPQSDHDQRSSALAFFRSAIQEIEGWDDDA